MEWYCRIKKINISENINECKDCFNKAKYENKIVFCEGLKNVKQTVKMDI